MKLLLGVYGMQEADAREFVKMANEMGADIKSYALRIGKIAVERYLQENTDTSVVIVSEALEARELIKISVLKNCADDPKELAQIVAERTRSQVVQVIGKKIVLYKEGKDEKKKIILP